MHETVSDAFSKRPNVLLPLPRPCGREGTAFRGNPAIDLLSKVRPQNVGGMGNADVRVLFSLRSHAALQSAWDSLALTSNYLLRYAALPALSCHCALFQWLTPLAKLCRPLRG
jgi:hypothetical protein